MTAATVPSAARTGALAGGRRRRGLRRRRRGRGGGLRQLRVELHRPRDLRITVGDLALDAQQDAEVVVRGGIVRLHRDVLPVEVDRLLDAVERLADDSEAEERGAVVRVDLERGAVVPLGDR